MRNRYHARRVTAHGISFASKAEAKRYGELLLLEAAGEIRDLEPHPSFVLLPKATVAGVKLTAVKYTADSRYFDEHLGRTVVEEVKSEATARETSYRLRRQLYIRTWGEQYELREVIR